MGTSSARVTVTKLPSAGGGLSIADPKLWQGGRPVVILSGCTWACSGGAQRPVALAREVGAMGHPVIYHTEQDPYSGWAGGPLLANKEKMQSLLPKLEPLNGIVYISLSPYTDIATRLQRAGWTVIYDVLDDWRAFNDMGNATWFDESNEVRMMRRADVVTVSAPKLAEIVKHLSGRDAHLVRNAGPARPFGDLPRPADMPPSRSGHVVYVGALWGAWFDWDMLIQTTKDLSRMQFTMIGDYTRKLPVLPNLRFLGPKPYPEAMAYLKHADCAIIPFKDDKVCASVDPVKYYDHVAARQWTVASAPLTDLDGREWAVLAGKGAKSLAPQIRSVLREERPATSDVKRWLACNCWRGRAEQMLTIIEEHEA